MLLIVLVGICAVSHACAADDAGFIAQDNSGEIESEPVDEAVVTESSHMEDELEIDTPSNDNNDYRSIQRQIDSANEGDTVYL